jgi:Fur family ferric uptake transcriptional regulator
LQQRLLLRVVRRGEPAGSVGARWHHPGVQRPRRTRRDHTHTAPPGPGALRSGGRRLTRQRQLIWEALTSEPDRHLSADELVERVRSELPRVNASTVYRTLDLLVEEGLVRRADLGRDRAFYEPAADHPHHHLVCERCGAVVHLHDEALGDLRGRIEAASGYTLSAAELTFFGTCPACSSKGRAR